MIKKIYKLRQTKLSQFVYFSLVLREREETKTKYSAPKEMESAGEESEDGGQYFNPDQYGIKVMGFSFGGKLKIKSLMFFVSFHIFM